MKKIAYLFMLIALLVMAGCGNEQIKEHGETVEASKYQQRFIHEEWDVDSSGSLGKREVATGIFESLDVNHDNYITRKEWDNVELYYPDNTYGSFVEWDLNDDSRVDKNEAETKFKDLDLYEKWNTNNNKNGN